MNLLKIFYFISVCVLGLLFYFSVGKFSYLFILSFLIVFLIMPYYINWAHKKNVLNIDCHKYEKPTFANMGGFVVLLGFFLGLFASFPFVSGYNLFYLIAGSFSILLVGFVGAFDDIFRLNEFQKIILLLVATVPLVAILVGDSLITIPFFGQVDIGLFYPFLVVPLLLLIYSNSTNMLAGYNGLESGLGIITLFFMLMSALLLGNKIVLFVILPMLGALIGFYYYNSYPAKVILGDVGTLSIGALFSVVMIIGNMELLGILLTLVYLVNFGLYSLFFFFIRGKDTHISSCDKNGYLIPGCYEKNGKKYFGWHKLYFLMENIFKGKLTEKKLVRNFFILHFVISLVVFFIYFL